MSASKEKTSDSIAQVEYDELGFVKNYVCPRCGGNLKLSHVDDIGTRFFGCQECGEYCSRPKSKERKDLEEKLKDMTRETTLEEISEILNSTIRHDERNKLITFLSMLLTYTDEDQINVSFTAESSAGKSYIPLELAWYFPKHDVIEYSYVSPTAFFHEYGVMMPDPSDKRDVEDKEKRKIIIIDLFQKILIFIDQPHDMLLQRLRPLLSHDRKKLISKITDRRERSGLRTKTVLIEGYPTVLFCSAKFSMEDQERTRLLMLSPETTQEKIREGILLRIEKESDRQAFQKYMENDPKRNWLKQRVEAISRSGVQQVIVSEELRSKIADEFLSMHNALIPRHQRDIGRLLALIKAHALLNLWHRERVENAIVINEEDVLQGFNLYHEVSAANELGIPPEVFNIYIELEPQILDQGLTRKEFQALYYQKFHRTIGTKRLDELLSLLQAAGLVTEEVDQNDRRRKLLLPTGRRVFNFGAQKGLETDEKLNTHQGVGEPTTCWICHKLLPEDLSETTEVDNRPVHRSCALEYKKGRKEAESQEGVD